MSEAIIIALIGGGATVIAASIGLIANAIKKKSVSNDYSVKQQQKGNNNTQIGNQIHIYKEDNDDKRNQ